jgi:hypothetical protein
MSAFAGIPLSVPCPACVSCLLPFSPLCLSVQSCHCVTGSVAPALRAQCPHRSIAPLSKAATPRATHLRTEHPSASLPSAFPLSACAALCSALWRSEGHSLASELQGKAKRRKEGEEQGGGGRGRMRVWMRGPLRCQLLGRAKVRFFLSVPCSSSSSGDGDAAFAPGDERSKHALEFCERNSSMHCTRLSLGQVYSAPPSLLPPCRCWTV